jgi:hypothetical protein
MMEIRTLWSTKQEGDKRRAKQSQTRVYPVYLSLSSKRDDKLALLDAVTAAARVGYNWYPSSSPVELARTDSCR